MYRWIEHTGEQELEVEAEFGDDRFCLYHLTLLQWQSQADVAAGNARRYDRQLANCATLRTAAKSHRRQ